MTTVTAAGSDLAASVRHANTAQRDLRLSYGQPPTDATSWVRCADLLAQPTRLADWAERVAGWLRQEYGEAPDRTVAGCLLAWYLTVPAKAGALLFHASRRVPDIDAAGLAVRFDGDDPRPAAVALLSDEFACLAGDPGAALPEATAVPDEGSLAALLRGRYATHATRFIGALAALDTPALGPLRLGRRALWASATDALDGACWRVGQSCGNEADGAAAAALVLPSVLPPFTSASTLRPDSATEGWTRRREVCCFHYVLRDGMGPCATCPRVCGR
ncbi:MAG TPA: iron-sulfur protein [Pseudonocardiaceae bacterium]|nr:iron-sulfur protein [Pseudonocardiaceae bacterium]